MTRASALDLVCRLHPEVAQHKELILDNLVKSHEPLGIGLDVSAEAYARALAGKWGTSPYDGPIRNGVPKALYQERFREMATEHLMVLRELAAPDTRSNHSTDSAGPTERR